MRSIGIALIGYGGIGRVHAMAYRDLPYHYALPADAIRIVGVATARRETAEAAAREIGCPVWTDDYRTLLARADVDLVDICVPNAYHEEILNAAAAAGKHVYIEKPLAMDLPQAERMAAALDAAGSEGGHDLQLSILPRRDARKATDGRGLSGAHLLLLRRAITVRVISHRRAR